MLLLLAALAACGDARGPERWRTVTVIDEFGDTLGLGAQSAEVTSLRPMLSPYTGTTARVVVDCPGVGIQFSTAPNLTDGSIQSGSTRYSLTVRVDGEDVGGWDVLQEWGSPFIVFLDSPVMVGWLSAGASTFAVSLPWYGDTPAFSWSLEGASELIRETVTRCIT